MVAKTYKGQGALQHWHYACWCTILTSWIEQFWQDMGIGWLRSTVQESFSHRQSVSIQQVIIALYRCLQGTIETDFSERKRSQCIYQSSWVCQLGTVLYFDAWVLQYPNVPFHESTAYKIVAIHRFQHHLLQIRTTRARMIPDARYQIKWRW